jgi:hypothetical protein
MAVCPQEVSFSRWNGRTIRSGWQHDLKKNGGIAGYGRPLNSGDEHIAPFLSLDKALGLDEGPYLRLAFAIDEYLLNGRF